MNLAGIIGRHPYELPQTVVPYASYLYCPFCGSTVHTFLPNDERMSDTIALEAELSAAGHFLHYHRARFWLHRRTGWKWPVAGWFR